MGNKIEDFIVEMSKAFHIMCKTDNNLIDRKSFAEQAKKTMCPPVLFALLDDKCKSVKEWLYNQSNDKVVKWIGADDE
jgi:protein associated with RNAse G/E